ncbi:hypothetical protein [Cohnella hashimotonis]|uniref:CHAT domain-containing protein n=1 Tax=Cohnella hashimotonis TaxID=2826895 RepID=A0ABT6TMA9_9BACL|nr:hypothetical protein [Cohnella hashimotonis]MDI4647885.1 hypothetical protein [Cohnella hashimotonis]
MKIIHFFPRSLGIRFLNSFKQFLQESYGYAYIFHDKSEGLVSELVNRHNETDIVIFTAHGTEDSIIGEMVKGEEVSLREDKLSNLKHSFVFSFSCSTGALGERLCLNCNVLSYIGFNDIINLSVKSEDNAFKQELTKVLKLIYSSALQISFDTFIKRSYDVGQFSRLISLNLKRSFSTVLAMNSNQLSTYFSISAVTSSNPAFIKKLHSDLLTTIDSVRSRIVVHGEKGFIPWFFIEDDEAKNREIILKLENVSFSSQNEYYRFFILAWLYLRIGQSKNSIRAFNKSHKLFPDFEPLKLFPFSSEDFEQLYSETEAG